MNNKGEMNSGSNFESLTSLIINNYSLTMIIDQDLVVQGIYVKEKESSTFLPRPLCVGKFLTDCMNLDLVKQIIDAVKKVQEKSSQGHFTIYIRTKSGQIQIITDLIRLPGGDYLATFKVHQNEELAVADPLEKKVITDIIQAQKIDQVIRIILDQLVVLPEIIAGGVYIYQYYPGEVSHQTTSEIHGILIEQIHNQIKESPFWININNGHTLFLSIEELNQFTEIQNISDEIKSFLFLPIYSNNVSLGNIILATRFNNYTEVEMNQFENYYSWFLQVLTSSINFRKLKAEFSTYINVLNESQDYFYVISPQGKLIFCNSAFQSKIKYNDCEIPNLNLSDIVPDLKDKLMSLIKSGAEINQDWHPLVYVDKFNKQFTLYTKLMIVNDGLMTVIAQKEKSEPQFLEDLSGKGIQIANNLSQPILLIDESTLSIKYANWYAHQFFGFYEEELNNQNFLELISERDHQFLSSSIREKGFFNFDGDRTWELRTRQKKKIRSKFISTVLNYEGKRSILLVIQEMDQEKIPTLIKDVSGFYNLLNQDLVIVRLTPAGIITHANERFGELIGKPLDKVIGKSFEENLLIEDYEPIFNHFSKLNPQNPIRKNTNRLVGANGSTIWLEWTDRGLFEGNELIEIYSIGKDISQEMQQNLIDQSREQRYQALVETLPLVIYAFHVETHFPIYVSPQIKTVTGYEAVEFYKTPNFLISIMHADDAIDFYDKTMERMQRKDNQPIEFRVYHKDGSIIWLEEIGTTITLSDGTEIFQGAVRDITESHEINEKLAYLSKIRAVLIDTSFELLQANHDNYSEVINKTIATIGKSLQVDRVILFEKDKPAISSSTKYEWCNEGIPAQIERLQSVSHATYPWWRKMMENNKEIIMDSVSDLPAEAKSERENVVAKKIKSLIAMPLYNNGKISGWMGFDMVREEVHWEEEIISLLRLLSAMIVNTNERIFHE